MDAFIVGILGNLLASLVYWSLLLWIARPRIRLSEQLVHDPAEPDFVRIKVANSMPWSASGLEYDATLVMPDPEVGYSFHSAQVRAATQAVLGGWALKNYRIARYGRMAASHRILSIRNSVPASISSGTSFSIVREIEGGGELVVTIRATDGALLALTAWQTRTYRAKDLVEGSFNNGRSLEVKTIPGHGCSGVR